MRSANLHIAFALVLVSFPSLDNRVAANPYGVAGKPSSLEALGMPEEAEVYTWNLNGQLYKTVRPYREPAQSFFWGWDPATERIGRTEAHRQQFEDYILANPGSIWIIGNEPDEESQDNLTAAKYARMYRAYRSFIRPLDHTARFAIGACAGVYKIRSNEWPHCRSWYASVLSSYRFQYSVRMPIDVWNVHAYYNVSDSDPVPQRLIVDFVDPFIRFVRTAENGSYVESQIIITEFGVYSERLSTRAVIDYMNGITYLFEGKVLAGELDRFFWFYGGWFDVVGWRDNNLLDPSGNPTPLGVAYAQRAVNW